MGALLILQVLECRHTAYPSVQIMFEIKGSFSGLHLKYILQVRATGNITNHVRVPEHFWWK